MREMHGDVLDQVEQRTPHDEEARDQHQGSVARSDARPVLQLPPLRLVALRFPRLVESARNDSLSHFDALTTACCIISRRHRNRSS